MKYAIYNTSANTIRTWVTAASGVLPAGYSFVAEDQVPHGAIVEAPVQQAEPVPAEVSRWALREVCMDRGHDAKIAAALESLPEAIQKKAKLRWAEKPTISKDSDMIFAMQKLLKWDDAYVDELFIAADALDKS
jgi:hypothetical protein